jgi:hypothetical protein
MAEVIKHGPQAIPEADYYEALTEGVDVCEWCPTPDGSGPPQQVHVHIPMAGGKMRILLRFKSADMLDAVIDALICHREGVWGERKL